MGEFGKFFGRSLADLAQQKLRVCFCVAEHPAARMIDAMGASSAGKDPWLDAWAQSGACRGMSAWVMPESLGRDLMDGGMGGLFSYAHAPSGSYDKVFCELLGPNGMQVSGSSWNGDAFGGEIWPLPIDVCSFELRQSDLPKAGKGRPAHWPEPLPLMERAWSMESMPSESPDFGQAALGLGEQMRRLVKEALAEERGFDPGDLEGILGAVVEVPAGPARAFARQDHPMFGAPKLDVEEKIAALEAINAALAKHEAELIKAGAPEGGKGGFAARIRI